MEKLKLGTPLTVNGKKVVTAEISFAVADPAPKSE